jgi:hypothetical protein
MRLSLPILLTGMALIAACGDGPAQTRATTLRWALTSDAEQLEFLGFRARQELFDEASRISRSEVGANRQPAPFLIIREGQSSTAPGLELNADLLQSPDAGQPVQLSFGERGEARWSEDRRAALGGLSEREAAEQVARSLLWLWNVGTSSVRVVRAPNAPFAAAYSTDDQTLWINPSFLNLAAAKSGISSHPTEVQ